MYSLDTNAARQADERNGRITEIGKYAGIFTRSEDVTSSKGTRGVDFAFETPERLSANFTLWTMNAKGEPLFGFKQLQALMACLRIKSTTPTRAIVKKWDRETSSIQEFDAEVFKELMDKKVGILFETEDYLKKDGSIGTKVVPAAFFEASSGLMAGEILDRKVEPVQLSKMILALRHRPLKRVAGQASQPGGPIPDAERSGLTLYPIASEYRQAADTLAELDLDEQTVADTLESISGDLTAKAQNVAFVIRNLETSAEQIKAAIEQMQARAQAYARRAERIKEYLLQNMLMSGVQKLECPYFRLAVRENPPKVVIDDERQIPMAYMTDPPPPQPKPDKKRIAQAIKDGGDVPGCRLERGNRLEIKS
ncbi:hypothetical protein DFQ28_008028 [Apophysomyces sp. BC1034]|nr:hypothetical protein DFQ28_008028 [Apophysomyces sp. BC1034]